MGNFFSCMCCVNIFELGFMSWWIEICKKNCLIDEMLVYFNCVVFELVVMVFEEIIIDFVCCVSSWRNNWSFLLWRFFIGSFGFLGVVRSESFI